MTIRRPTYFYYHALTCRTHLRSTANSSLTTSLSLSLSSSAPSTPRLTTPSFFLLANVRSPPYGLQAITQLGRSFALAFLSALLQSPFIPTLDAFLLHIHNGANCMCPRRIGCYGRLHGLSHYWRNISFCLVADTDFPVFPFATALLGLCCAEGPRLLY